MPVSYTLVGRLLTISCVGTYPVTELHAVWTALAQLPNVTLPLAMVLDIRDSDSVLRRSISDMRGIVSSFMQHAAKTDRRLAIVTRGAARYGLMRMAATWAELAGIEAQVFRELSEAQHWALSQLRPTAPPEERC